MKKIIAMMLLVFMLLSLTACGTAAQSDDGTYVIGICQIMVHNSLDDATQGFKDAVVAGLGEDHVVFNHRDAGGEFTNCGTIMDGFVAEGVDLILADATAPLQAAQSATSEIPVLGNAVTDYATALNIADYHGTVGGNISGTTDLAPMDQQASIIQELFPDAKNVGMLYCSAEVNSVYQIQVVKNYLTDMGYTCTEYAFADVNEMFVVLENACDNSDVLYVPTDNTCAANPEIIANVAMPAGVPVVTSDAATCAVAGVATMAISYYDLGYATGEMAVKILKGEADISEMPIQVAGEAVKQYNPVNCEKLGIPVPAGYTPVE